ncbi:fat-like cadherin-related tumor suppressor homolog isoform X3 [Homarus americanus]|uniref:fat-like cadherin-related tumor suppressor homolog isoform X3 n=1 Tax=Homarus americanus TaxID=6706 RepID=UPI001C49533C|nr:fat-like cadherin-related tumor suppressor homolog isoform X3 [Homarus americanus]
MTQTTYSRPHPRGRPPPPPPHPQASVVMRTCMRWQHVVVAVVVAVAVTCGGAAGSVGELVRFSAPQYNASVPENALGNTAVISDTMMGIYATDPALKIKYRITEGDDKNFFRAARRVVGDFSFLELRVRTGNLQFLNRESRDQYRLKVKAQHRRHDGTKEDLPGAVTEVVITITDLNDISPFFLQEEYRVRLSEDTPLHASVARVKAEDPDDGLNGQVYYSFLHPTSVFAIHPTSGVVTLTRPLSFLDQAAYELTVQAQDRGRQHRGGWPAHSKLYINVTEENVYDPQILVNKLPESMPRAHLAVVAIISIMDQDRGPSGEVRSLEIVEGDPDRVFRILPGSDANEFNLAALDTIDWNDSPFGFNLTLKATDGGNRPRFSYKVVRVAAPPGPQHEEVFTQKLYEASVSEKAPIGTRVLQVGSWLPGAQRRVQFTVLAGNKGRQFHLDPFSGVITTGATLDAEIRTDYTLTVGATSPSLLQPQQQASAKVIIRVMDANDNTPMIVAPQGVVRVEEHHPAGTWVTKVRAQDYDSGENGYVSYSLANADDVPFTVDHFTGEVRTTRALDYETERRTWRLLVRASDWGSPYRRQSEKIITVHVEDVNDNRPQFERVDCTGYIDRFTPLGSEVFTLSAVDFDQGNIISYRIVGGNEDHCFSLDSTTGVLTLTCDLQDLTASERLLNVTATDGQHFADTLALRLQLVRQQSPTVDSWASLDCREMGVAQRLAEQLARAAKNNRRDDPISLLSPPPPVVNAYAPELLLLPLEVRVRENSDPGTVVLQVDADDEDSGYPGHLVYAISSGNEESVFMIDMETGSLTVAGLLDRERLARYNLNLTVYDLGRPQRSTYRQIAVTLVDENDNAPDFDKPAYSFFLPENVANGTSVYELRAHDPDEGINGVVTYSLATDTKDFRLDPVTGRLSVAWPLDHETHDVYELRVVASDGGARSAHAYVTIQVANINDCPPVFPTERSTAVRVPEDLPEGALVTLVTAHDPDSPRLRYSLVGGYEDMFELDEDTAALRLAKSLDYETRPAYNITVRATDDGTPPLSARTHVIIQVVDVDENVHAPVFMKDVEQTIVLESSPPHTLVATYSAVDGDPNPADAAITYSLVGSEGRGVFYIDQKGSIYTSSWLDRETVSRYWLSVRAQDSGTVPKHATLHVYVEVADVNDHRPLSSWPVYWPGVTENSPPGTRVVTVDASDPDPGANITYNITAGNPQSLFTIDSKTGEIHTTARRLDRETQAEHVLEVTISDGDDPTTALSSTTYIAVNVLDENDHAPVFLERLYKFFVPVIAHSKPPMDEAVIDRDYIEDMPIGQVVAVDEDEDDNGDISYHIESTKWHDLFKVHQKTGVISAKAGLDPREDYEFTVQAIDNGRPQKSNSCLVLINLVPVLKTSPNAPVMLDQPEVRVTVLESDPIGHHVTLIEAQDDDGDQLWFDIIGGDEENMFTVGRDTGGVMVAGHLDAEQKSTYNLTISVTDGVHVVTTQLIVSVLDVNDYRPAFSEPTYEVEVGENTAPGTTIFTLTASDPDSDQHLTFTLINTAHISSATKFRVSSTSGDIVLYEPLDREVQEEHILTVGVKDGIPPTKGDYARVIIKVHDYNDHAPQFLATLYNGTVTETATIGTTVAEVIAVDRDKGANGHIMYSIVSGNIGGVFSLDPETGIISLARAVDRQEMPEYWLAVRGSDNGSPPRHSHVNVNIHVKIANSAPPRFLKKVYVFEVSESSHVGDYLGVLEAESRLGVVFSFIGESRRNPFAINPASGMVSLDIPVDYEEVQSYNFTVLAASMNGQEATAQLIINIRDENDNPPYFTQSSYSGHISEAAAVNSVVLMEDNSPLVISARDKDSDQNSNLVFTILEEEARMYFTIDSSTGAIRTVAPLDHEVISEVSFSVKVHDNGQPRLCASTTAAVAITITDINDVPPRFLLQEYNATLLTPTQKDVSVVQLNATDLDFDGKANLEYEIADGNKDGMFMVNSKTGLITVNNSNNLATHYQLKVTVNDGQFASSAAVNIYVEPIPRTGLRFSEDKYFAAVEENSTRVDKVSMVHVLGSNLNEHLRFSILNPTDMFTIGDTSGVIQTTGNPFDREVQDNYLLIIEVRSVVHTTPARVAHVQVHVVVTDKNDNAPIFVNTPYYGVISVDAKKHQVVFRVHATDFDADENRDVRYELQRGNGEVFAVSRSTGEISLKQTLEGLKSEYELIISAYDGGSTPLSSQIPVRLKVVDRSQPIFDRQFYSATVAENADSHTPIVTVTAHSQLNRKLIYTIVGGNEHQTFAMEHEEGLIRVQDGLDFETRNSYQLTVRATDSYSGKWAEVVVSVQVIDVNDNPPEFLQHFYNVTVSEATAIATPILTVSSSDQDTGPNAGVSYRLMGLNGTLPKNFYMEGDSGILILKQGLDRETAPVHHFLVQAIDKGTPPLSSTAHILVTVLDMNDNPPVFEQQAQRCVVTEDASRGHFVTLVSASDEDISDVNKLTYSVVDGNELQVFAINSASGIVTVWNSQKLRENNQHILNVSVSDGVFTAYTRLVVSITPVNAHSPTFKVAQYDAHIQENSAVKTTVAQVSARDVDSGRYGDVTYHFIGDDAQKFFRINENTGDVWTSEVFDREERAEYAFTVMAMDIGGRTGFTTLHITVNDVNDNKPVFMQTNYKAIIRSNTTSGSVVLKVFAVDADKGENGTVSYNFHSSALPDTMDAFSINSRTGEISLKRNAHDLGSSVFEFFIESRDEGRPSLHSNVAVLLRIVDVDVRPPEFLSQIYTLTVAEDTPPGTRIGSVGARYDGELEYSVEWGGHETSPPVSVSSQGTLTLTSLLDHEDIHRLSLIVTALPTDKPELASSTNVVIEVQDVNDESPAFESEKYYVSVAENTPSGSNVVKVFAHDRDAGSNSEIRYILEEQSPLVEEPLFTLDPYSGWLSLNQELDAETKSKYDLKVLAKDNGTPQRSSTTSIIIEVIDYNDNAPQFVKEKYHASVRENALPGTVVVQLEVLDYDLGGGALDGEMGQGIIYYLTAGNALQHFHVRGGGQIYVAKALDWESVDNYALEVTATDGVFVAKSWVFIQVLDVNDNGPLCTTPFYRHTISEAALPGTPLLRVSATDHDLSPKPQFYLTGQGAGMFAMDINSGQLSVAKPLDRERQSDFMLKATVKDGEKLDWECTCQVEIQVTDVNDNPPIFGMPSYSINVPENSPENLLLLKVHASDPDKGINRKVTYALEGHNIFVMDQQTGILSVTETLDRESRAMYNLTVIATDHGSPKLSSRTNILVLVSDVNDNPPEFASHTYFTTVTESANIGSDIVRVLATSRDSGKNAEITYSIIGGNEHRKFAIHPKTGVVSILDPLDYERAHSYQLTVQATDGGEPPLSNHATINVTVTDINDNEPIFLQNSYSVIVNEAAIIGERLIQVIATDLDSQANGRITYGIANGDPNHQFRIDQLSGWISVAGPLDRETVASYNLEVIALDQGIPQRSGSVMVNIEVSDANDNPPIFVETNHTAYVQEDKPVNHLVFKFDVIDKDDAAHNGGPFTFEIISGNDNTAFRITQDGHLRTATKFNHKVKGHYRLQIRVYDNGRPLLYSETWIDVKIIEESRYHPVVFPLQVTVFVQTGEYFGGVLGKVKAADEDPYDTLTYSIMPDPLGVNTRYFGTNPQDGTLSAQGGLDEGTYTVNVSVTDGKFTTFSEVEVDVVDISDDMVENAVILRLGGANPEEFLLSYRRSFHRGVKNLLNAKSRDVIILSLQNSNARVRRDKKKSVQKSVFEQGDLDILFVVRKSSYDFYPRNLVRKKISSGRQTLESVLGLRVIGVVEDECTENTCENGHCEERIALDDDQVAISTDTMSFVSLHHRHESKCICPNGFSGARCDIVVNQCAYKPCPSYKNCVPDSSTLGYVCLCPEGLVGATCKQNKSSCIGKANSPECYSPVSPLSFKGKSYAQYSLRNPIERHFSFSLWFRTLHPSGNLMFTAGRIDYSILELEGGELRYRWDLGSGEGMVAVTSLRVDDGQWHHVNLERFGNTAELTVDGQHRGQGASPGSSDLLNLDTPHLYLGAEVRPWAGAQDPRQGLVGCVDDPRVDDTPLPLTHTTTTKVASLTGLTHVAPHCQTALQPPGVCGAHPCLNGGTCEERGASFICQCHPRFQGSRCELDSNPCASSPCLNNGHCVNVENAYRCECPARVSGLRCQYMYCNPNPCLNRGICEEGISGPICKCRGFTGAYCNIDINECAKNPCHNGGTCINSYGSFRCMCPGNATGTYCDSHIGPLIDIGIEEIIYIVIGIVAVIILGLIIVLAMHCRERRAARRRQLIQQTNHVILKPKNTDNHNIYKRNSKMSNLEASQNPHGCTPRPDSYPTSPSEPAYMPLNNFDTIRSYGSAGDELENLPQYPREFVQNISKSNSLYHHHTPQINPLGTPRGSTLGSMVGSGLGSTMCSPGTTTAADTDSLHKPWKDALAHNLKDTYYENNKIQNDVKFRQGEYLSLKKLSVDGSTRDDASVRSGTSVDDLPGYHWDCSDWARPSQNPLPNIMEVPGGEVRDSSSYHSNESNESIVVEPTKNQPLMPPVEGPVDPGRDMETLPADELISECDTEFELESRPDMDTSQLLDPNSDAGAESDTSLFTPQPQRYETHPNQYLPHYQIGSETETEDERSKLLNTFDDPYSINYQPPPISHLPEDRNGVTYSPYRIRSNRRHDTVKRFSEFGGDMSVISGMEDEEEGASLWGGAASNTSASDLDNVCDIEDSEVNSEFENDDKTKK